MSDSNRFKSILGNAVAALGTTLIMLLVAEWVATYWLMHYSSQDQFRQFATLSQNEKRFASEGESASKYHPHRFLGYTPSPNYTRGKNYHNANGYRGESIPPVKSPDEFRIVCVGGSTTYTSSVENPSDAYPAVLEKQLHDHGYLNVRVINAGAEGWSSWESLVNVNFRVLDLDPDMVIIYHAVNDVISRVVWPPEAFQADRSGSTRHFAGKHRAETFWERRTLVRIAMISQGKWSSPLELRNAFDEILPTNRFWTFYAQYKAGTYPEKFFAKTPIETILSTNTTEYFRRNMESMVASCEQQGVTSVLATFKVNRDFGSDGSADSSVVAAVTHPAIVAAIEEHNEVTRSIGDRLDVPVFDFSEVFPSSPEFFADPVHLTIEGAREKGVLFAQFLVDEKLVNSQR